ncbi:MAG: DEAD/DEAH box helicase, partial [Mycoplasma sp.]|nr:DEAD/DEAH box helicase [Mycoplasma sp.]
MQRKEVVERFLKSIFINNEKQHLFNDEELSLIYNDKYKFDCILDDDKSKIKLLYLIANFESNLSQDFIIFAKNFLNLLNGFYSEKEIENWDYYGIKVKDLTKNTITINDKKLTLEQTLIYEIMHKTDIFLKAGTGVGKTLISSHFLIEKYREYIKNKNTNCRKERFVFIVPTEILEEQIKHNLSKYNEDIKSEIGNSIEENSILIITWEKLAPYVKWDELTIKINTLILDEAFLLFDKNNDRSLFLKHIIKSYIKNSITKNRNVFSRIILLSPISPSKENIIELKEIFKDTDHKFKYLDFDTSNDVSNKLFINRFDITENNEKKFEKAIEKSTNDSTCIYFENKTKAKKQIKSLYKNHEFIKKIKLNNRDIFTQEQINSFFNDGDLEIYDGYNNFEFIKSGICYLTSDTPDHIKNLIIRLVEEKYIKIVAATYIIINGIDLPFDNAFLSSNLVNKKMLTTEEIVNFIGRSGRKNKFKKGYSLGNVYIKVKKQNIEWFKKNKNDLINYVENNKKIKNYSTNEINEKLFIKESYQLFNETNDSYYLIDPRINPKTTEFIINNISIEDYRYILSILTSNPN